MKRDRKADLTKTKCQNLEVSSAEKTEIKINEIIENDILPTKKKRSQIFFICLISNFKKKMKNEK